MAILKYKDENGNYQPIVGVNVQNEVVQTTGQSTTAVMSQKAVSDLIPAQASASNQLADKDFVNSSVSTATAEIKGNATSACDTLGEAEAKINANAAAISNEATRAEEAEEALDGRVDTLEDAVGIGGSVDSRISAAVATETTRAQAAESTLSSGKADKATTLAGYGITDAYTKSETYTKTEVNGLVDTPHQEYVTVDAYANLPETGSKDTIYRVSNYNGSTSQVDASVYSEYAWNGSQYIFLCVKSQIGEVFDISVYNNNAKYVDLASALGTNGANVPEPLRKGGMSVKFVHSSDNKYIQARCIAQNFTTDITQWQEMDVAPTFNSQNFAESGGVWNQFQSVEVNINNELTGVIDFTNSADRVWYTVAGEKTYNTNRKRTNFVPVKLGDIFKYYLNNTTTVYEVCALDKDFNLIPSQSVVGSGTVSERTYTVSDASVCYLIFCDHQVNNPYCRKNDYFLKRIDARFAEINTGIDNDIATINGGLGACICSDNNVFNKKYSRTGKGIDANGAIVDYDDQIYVLSRYFLIPTDCTKIVVKGIKNVGAQLRVRACKAPFDNSEGILVGSFDANYEFNPQTYISTYPYMCFCVCRSTTEPNLDNCAIYFLNENSDTNRRLTTAESNISSMEDEISEIKEQAFKKLEVFDKTAVRRNYAIKSSSPYQIIEYEGIIVSGFIDVRKFKKIVYSGISTSGAVFARLSKTAEDNSDSMLITIAASGNIDITSEMSEYPYLVMDVYRGSDADTASLDSVSILGYYKTESLESRIDTLEDDVYQSGSYMKNLIRLQNISPTKATVCFALDLVGDSNVLEYLDLLAEYNINSANVFVIPRLLSQSTILEECAQIINKGATVELHSDPLDNITPESSLTESQYYDLIAGYLDTMKGAGFYPSGFVASQGNMKEAYIPWLSNVMCWASTTSNIIARTQTSLEAGYNTPQTNRCNIKRIGLDLRPVDATEENVTRIVNMVKTAVDDAVENGYYLVFYVHSYDKTELDYTGREELLRPILAYIKGYADKYRINCGNIGELLNVYYK